ncbi:MAG: uroporphyrinogen decarboxylase family protein [Dehalococcoidia bacterium]
MSETLETRWQRVEAAIRLEPTDRTPVVPLIDAKFACRYQGMTQGQSYREPDKAAAAIRATFEALGGYDAAWAAGNTAAQVGFMYAPQKIRVPGKHLPDDVMLQNDEGELFTVEDYDRIIDMGWNGFIEEFQTGATGRTWEQIQSRLDDFTQQFIRDKEAWEEMGVPVLTSTLTQSTLMLLSCGRSLTQFTLDLYRRPDKVEKALEATAPDLIGNAIKTARTAGIPRVVIFMERGSGFYYPLKIFERFEFPYLKMMVSAFLAEGITPILHFDTDWIMNLPHLRELPRGGCLCQFDNGTDIFKAKEVLRDHLCIMGDVPAALLSVGSREEVRAYCQKLMDVCGEGGGFILSTGSITPIDARFENVKELIDTGKSYKPVWTSGSQGAQARQ